ncbi:MAG TPA: hypothetical protein VF498_14745 [Anaerolineales bacterium]
MDTETTNEVIVFRLDGEPVALTAADLTAEGWTWHGDFANHPERLENSLQTP